LETKGEHLKGNDDTEYKRRLFELLTKHADAAGSVGELEIGDELEPIKFRMVIEGNVAEQLYAEGLK
tara:strand:+ start:211 stop:411 length:201 start_codon:yes stop_codon:yes gene_type:complete